MTEIQTIETEKKGRPRPRLAPAVLIVGVALVAIAAYLGRQVSVADPDTPAEAVALAYLDALASNDAEALHELVAPASDVDWNDQSGLIDWRNASGVVITRLDCIERSTGPDGTLVDCPWIYGSDWHRALGFEPSSMQQVFLVKDGKIQEETSSSSDENEVARVWNEFRTWVAGNHGADLATMYDDVDGGAHLTPESIALWEQYTDEFVAEMEG